MIRHRQRSLSAVRVVAHHRNVLTLSNDSEPEQRERFNYLRFWDVDWEFWQLSCYLSFGNKHFQDGRLNFKYFASKSFEMETNRRLHVGERFFVAITFAHNDAFEAERISDVSVRVFFDNDLLGFHGVNTSTNSRFCSGFGRPLRGLETFLGPDPR